ncbi:MAG: hypothetical protein ACRDVZ_12555, partial [Jiangellaceae bacterium]
VPSPGVSAVIEALRVADPRSRELAKALTIFAWERVGESSDLACTMAEVDALWDLLESAGLDAATRTQAHHWVVDGWVEATAATRDAPILDPLSGLHTAGYLIGRVHELDRLAGLRPNAMAVIVIRWPVPEGPWQRIAMVIEVGSTLRDNVRSEATLSQIGSHTALVLVPDDARVRLERAALVAAFEFNGLAAAGVEVWVMTAPTDRSELTDLIARLRNRPPWGRADGTADFAGTTRVDLDCAAYQHDRGNPIP